MDGGKKRGIWMWIAPAGSVALLSVAWPVLLFTEFYNALSGDNPDGMEYYWPTVFVAGLVLTAVSAIVAIVAHLLPSHDPVRERRIALLVKLGMIPFFAVWTFLGTAITLTGIIWPLFLVFPVYGVLIGYPVMLCGSAWGICSALSLRKAGMLDKSTGIALIALQFLFVADVVAVIVLFFLGRTQERLRTPA